MKKIYILIIILFFCVPFLAISQSCVGTSGQVKWSYWTFPSFPDSSDLQAHENYPSRPDGFQMMGSTQSPINYADYFASMMRGFISVPTTENYQFNVTGDDRALFYLSTNATPQSKIRRAYTTRYTNITQYNVEASQKSGIISLTGGQNYYFELLGFEGGGGDHVTLYWRKQSNPDTTWKIIDYTFLKEYTCGQVCPPRGTVCNDNNPNTTNDQQDGFCNCVGTATSTNTCVGTKGLVEAYYYDNINGDRVEPDLITASRFPFQPHRMEKLTSASGPLKAFANDNYGTMLQGYLTVPVTGSYSFNVTGDNETQFFLSKNDSIEYKQFHQAITFWGVDETQHNNSTFQTVGPIILEKGKYYYYEFRHKESSWRDHFNLYWKTPFHEQKTWKKISNFYLFDYNCELACIPQGTPCNDNNAFTNNDVYNNNCECLGTPCIGANCDDLSARFVPYEICSPTKNLVPDPEFAWESCQNAPNPNSSRASTKWIKYDLGDIYSLKNSRIWNYNALNETDKGFKNVVFDISLNGFNWTPIVGTFQWQQASGLSDYAGFTGPNFGDVKAKYILISAIDNWGDPSCSGFSKITFDGQLCNNNGSDCDDDDPLTIHDKFDSNCNCKGVKIECLSDTIQLGKFALLDTTYQAKDKIMTKSFVNPSQNVSFTAGNSIVFLPGFEVKNTGVFKAEIKNCLQSAFVQNQTVSKVNTNLIQTESENEKLKKIIFKLKEPTLVKLTLKNSKGNLIATLINDVVQTTGTQIKYLPTNKLQKGIYWVELIIKNEIMKEQFEVK